MPAPQVPWALVAWQRRVVGGDAKREVWRWVIIKCGGLGLGMGVDVGELFLLGSSFVSEAFVGVVVCDLWMLFVDDDDGVVGGFVRCFLDAGLVSA